LIQIGNWLWWSKNFNGIWYECVSQLNQTIFQFRQEGQWALVLNVVYLEEDDEDGEYFF